jgi:citrate lyase subunit beta/citryl-CoA lyase
MTTTLRPRRSVLYMPGSNARALEKAKTLAADAFIFDLEDAVSPDAKPTARQQVVAAVESRAYGQREIAVRINAPGTPWYEEDIAAAVKAKPHAILVPKVNSAAMVLELQKKLEALGAPESVRLWAMMESPIASLNAAQIAAASPRLDVFVLGTNDLARELCVPHVPGRAPMLTALQLCVLAARAHNLVVIDGVYNDIANAEGFVAECKQGRDFGFDGKTLIHPSQLEPCNAAFSPTPDELEYAKKIIAAFKLAEAEGRGVITVDGKMVEELHLQNARRSLALDEAIQKLKA